MVYFFLAPGFEESEAVVPADLLRQADVEVALVALSGSAVTGSHNITIQTDRTVEEVDLDQAEMLVFPGGGTGVEHLWNDDRVSALIQEAARRGLWLAALCAAPVLLARWGLLNGHKAVSYPTRQNQLDGAEVMPEARAVIDGTLITGHACGSSFDFGLKLVEALRGKEAAQAINDRIFYFR